MSVLPKSLASLAALLASIALLVPPVAAMNEDLLKIYGHALEADAEFQAAVAANLAAREATPQARAALLPNVSAGATADSVHRDFRRNTRTANRGTDHFERLSFGLTLRQPVYRHDLWTALRQAGLSVQEADLTLAAAQQALMLRASERYFEVLRARAFVRSARAAREAFGQQLEQARQRFEVGLIATTDVEEARSGFDRATADEISAVNSLDNAYEALREITGQYFDLLADVNEELEPTTPAPNDIDQWTRQALDQNLELGAARLRAERAEKEISRQYAGHLPTLDLVGSHARNTDDANNERSASWTSFVGVELNVPIFSGGAVTSRTREARALFQQRSSEVEQARRSAQRETRAAFLGVQSGISRIEALQQAVRSARSAREAVVAGFEVGTRTSLDVLNADRDLFEAQFDLASSRYDYILDVLRLKRAAGTLAEEDLAATNELLQ